MKILQVIPNMGTGGAEKLLLDSIPLYIDKGIDMELLLLESTPSPFLEKLKEAKVTIHQLSGENVYSPLHVLRLIPFLKKFTIIHVHLFPAFYWVALAKMLSFSNVILLYTEHNTNNKRREHKILKFIDRFFYKFYQKIITISTPVDKALRYFLKTKRVVFYFIPNGIDLSAIKKASPIEKQLLQIPNNSKTVLQVSSFTTQKDQKTLIKSFVNLGEQYVLLLVGDGPTLKEHKELVQKLKLETRVFFLGIRMDIPSLLKTVDVIVLSSHHEGLSLSSIEGLASGAPFIASNVSGLTEIVEGAGVLFEKGNDKQLADIIRNVTQNVALRNKIIYKCLERAEHYSINKMIQEHIILYNKIQSN